MRHEHLSRGRAGVSEPLRAILVRQTITKGHSILVGAYKPQFLKLSDQLDCLASMTHCARPAQKTCYPFPRCELNPALAKAPSYAPLPQKIDRNAIRCGTPHRCPLRIYE
jgi:hypothetical protein